MNQKQYRKYLQSPEWKARKEPVLERDNYACTVCGSNLNLHVHHLHYDNIGEESLSDLATLCKSCHFKHEFIEHPEFGKYIYLHHPRKKFTKVYHRHIPKFTNPTYAGFWFDLITRLSHNSNIIYCYHNNKIVYATTRKDLMKICQAKQSKFYAFLKECIAKNYIVELGILRRGIMTNQRLYIINPYYALNGNRIPEVLYNLFNKPVEDYQREYDKDHKENRF